MSHPPKASIKKTTAVFISLNALVMVLSGIGILIAQSHGKFLISDLMSAVALSSLIVFFAYLQFDALKSGQIKLGRASADVIIRRDTHPLFFWFFSYYSSFHFML